MRRFKLVIEYDGTPYQGWQSQAEGRGVQDALERVLWAIEPDAPRLKCAGRTDAGVHALGQVSHVDLAKPWTDRTLRDALNAHLKIAGEAVSVLSAEPIEERFDCRLWARRRHYRYRLLNRPAPSALDRTRVWHIIKPLDIEAMHEAAQSILGQHDFTTFRASACQAKSPIRTLEEFRVFRAGEEVHIEASARSFLHNQVRSMVGSLVQVGRGIWPVSRMRAALDAKDRAQCGPVAPACGLYFTRVDY
ncbi:MAG: tRNA pseudouridine(38-40) synthase TruA [Methylobacterium sp.]